MPTDENASFPDCGRRVQEDRRFQLGLRQYRGRLHPRAGHQRRSAEGEFASRELHLDQIHLPHVEHDKQDLFYIAHLYNEDFQQQIVNFLWNGDFTA